MPRVQPGVSPTACLAVLGAVPGSTTVSMWCRVVAGCTRVPGGASVDHRHARNTGWDECIYGVPYKARLGQGRCKSSARMVPGTVPGTVPEPVPLLTCLTPDTRHPPPDTQHPPPIMYPGYIVTQCLPYEELLLPYPISRLIYS